jgi:uroporphyrinogen-III synthase
MPKIKTATDKAPQIKTPKFKTKPAAPLRGVRVLVGRASHQARDLSSGLRRLGATVIEIPFIEISPSKSYEELDGALQNIGNYDWLILTSVNGVAAVWERMSRLKIAVEQLRHLKVAAIGPATKKAIENHGLKVDVVPTQYVAESVVESLRKKVDGSRILLARAKVARDVIPADLRKLGADVTVAEAYETVVPRSSKAKLRELFSNSSRRPHLVTFTSSSSVRNFRDLAGFGAARNSRVLDGVTLASIGPVTSAVLRELGLPVHIEAKRYTIPGLIKAIAASAKVRSPTRNSASA